MTECKLPKGQVNKKVARLNALVTLILSLIFIFTSMSWVVYIMIADFLIKGFVSSKYSPISKINMIILKIFKIKPEPIFAPPKIFASKIGFLFLLAVGILFFLNLSVASVAVIAVLAFFAFLEATFEICVGCWMHSYWLKIFNKGD